MLEILKRHGIKGTNCNYTDVSVYGVMNTVMSSWESDRCSLISMQKKIYYECIIFYMDLESEEDASSVVSEDATEVGSQSSSEDSA
eukprot:scaffold12602_cov78-Skeletonema_dohrnii-CCMP3373.AAC.2